MRYFFLLWICTATVSVAKGQLVNDQRILEPAAMKEDFRYLRNLLEQAHPGLYIHHSKEEMQHIMDSLFISLDKPLPFLQFYAKIACLVAEVRCEHTYCRYGKGFDTIYKKWKLLPLQLYFAGDKCWVTVNCTTDDSILPDDELLSINGFPIDSIKKELYKYIPSDGYMTDSKDQALSGMLFNINYYQFIEQPASYTVVTKNKEGKVSSKIFGEALTLPEINSNAAANKVNKEVFALSARLQKIRKNELELEYINATTALLTVRSFSVDKEKFLKKIDTYFTDLKKKGITHLVIDVSNNGGGEEELAAELLSYLIKEPTRFIESEYLITVSDEHFALSNLPKEAIADKYAFIEPMKDGKAQAKLSVYSQELKWFDPKPDRFTGKVFIYANGITSSAASTFAAVAQSNKLAVIVGQETAGCYVGGGTTNGLDITLPNSLVTAHLSMVYQVFATKGGNKHRGVIPDYSFITTLDDLLYKNRPWLSYIGELIVKGE